MAVPEIVIVIGVVNALFALLEPIVLIRGVVDHQIPLAVLVQIGQLNGGTHFNPALVHKFKQFRNMFTRSPARPESMGSFAWPVDL